MGVAGKDFEELKAGTPQLFHLWNVFVPHMGTQSKIHQGAILQVSNLFLQETSIADGMAVGVLNHRRDPTYSCGAGTRDKIFTAAVARILKMDMAIDHPREDPQTRSIAVLTRLQAICGEVSNHTLLNVEVLVL